MAYSLVQSSGLKKGANGTWSPGTTPVQNNLITAQEQNDSSNVPGTSDFKDSAGSPNTLTRDTPVTGMVTENAANYSLVVPSGWTSPLKGAAVYEEWMACEWSGNATSSVLDANNSAAAAISVNGTTATSAAINTGANAGLVLATASINLSNSPTNESITVTGTSFGDTYSTSHDGTDQNNSASDAGTCNFRTASCASQSGLTDSWSFISASSGSRQANAISSYNVPAAGGAAPAIPELRRLRGMGI